MKQAAVYVVAALLIVGLLLAVFFGLKGRPTSSAVFNSPAWLNGSVEERYAMHNNLIESNLLLQKSDAEVALLIGLADAVSEKDNGYEWQYDLGEQKTTVAFMFSRHYWLHVVFNNQNSVQSVYSANHD